MFCRAIPYEGKEPYIFVSYCHADKERIYPLIEQMSLDGYRAWYDVGNQPGLNWMLNIEEHLEKCKTVIAFISKSSSDSNNCNKEIIYAMKCGKKVIPILIEEVALPKGLRMQMVDLHYLERKDFPSDKALLQKCYETEGCPECKNPSGSIPLRPGESVRDSREHSYAPPENMLAQLQQVSVSSGKKCQDAEKEGLPKEEMPQKQETLAEAPPKEKAPPKREIPVEVPPKTAGTVADANMQIPDAPGPGVERTSDDSNASKAQAPGRVPSQCVVSPQYDSSDEATVYVDAYDNGAVMGGPGIDLDDDRTVCVSRSLAILLHPAKQMAYKLKSPKIAIGRSQIRCDVAIEGNNSISKIHAFIWQTDQICYLEDAHSSNGTFVNGEKIEPEQRIPLENPAVFQLNDETLILLSGDMAYAFEGSPSISLLINEKASAVRIMEADALPLDRNHTWPDGTLSDRKIHRKEHAVLYRQEDSVYLIDRSPEKGNGTYLNGSRLRNGETKLLTSGDKIRLGDTNLTFVSIEIPF